MLEPGFTVTSPRGTIVGPPLALQKALASVLGSAAGARGIGPIVPPGI